VAAARAMTDAHYRSVLVVNGAGKPLGVVSGADLLEACEEADCSAVTVSQVMHPALTIHMTASLREAADLMIQRHHHRLIVVDPAQPEAMPLGVISSIDIVAEMARPESVWQASK
jgi:CBS domain-containing protein